jgi:hypothetical protein
MPGYGFRRRHEYSNVSRGRRKERNEDEWVPCILEAEGSSKEHRKNWAGLIQKIYEIDPLTCPKCQGRMKTISFIEDEGLPRGFLQEYKTEPGGFGGYGFCYLYAISHASKKVRFDIHTFSLTEAQKFD